MSLALVAALAFAGGALVIAWPLCLKLQIESMKSDRLREQIEEQNETIKALVEAVQFERDLSSAVEGPGDPGALRVLLERTNPQTPEARGEGDLENSGPA